MTARSFPNVTGLRMACVYELIDVYGVDVPADATDAWVDEALRQRQAGARRRAVRDELLRRHGAERAEWIDRVLADPITQGQTADTLSRLVDQMAHPRVFVSAVAGERALGKIEISSGSAADHANFKVGMRIESSSDGVNFDPVDPRRLVLGVDYGAGPSVSVTETWRVGPNGEREYIESRPGDGITFKHPPKYQQINASWTRHTPEQAAQQVVDALTLQAQANALAANRVDPAKLWGEESRRARTVANYLAPVLGGMLAPPEPPIHISESFAELAKLCTDPETADGIRDFAPVGPHGDAMENAAIANASLYGLEYQPGNALGKYLCIKRGGNKVQLSRYTHYALCPVGHEVEGARQLVKAVGSARGPGRWWTTAGAVHYIADDGQMRVADVGGVPYVWLRAFYYHDPSCPLCGKPCDRVTVGGGIKLSGCECVGTGDRVVAFAKEPNRLAKIERLNADLKAGRFRLPQEKAVWMREFMGEWVEPDAPPHHPLVDRSVARKPYAARVRDSAAEVIAKRALKSNERPPVPECCGKPMRPTGMGERSGMPRPMICSVCERYRGPQGAMTPDAWWRSDPPGVGQCAWNRAQGPVYVPPTDHDIAAAFGDRRCNHVMFEGAPVAGTSFSPRGKVAWCAACLAHLDEPPPAKSTREIHADAIAALTRAGRVDAVAELVRKGAITAEQARDLLNAPAADTPTVATPKRDGLTDEQCFELYERFQRDGGPRPATEEFVRGPSIADMGKDQLIAARARWSAELRARVDAAKERERHRVVLDLDPEDL